MLFFLVVLMSMQFFPASNPASPRPQNLNGEKRPDALLDICRDPLVFKQSFIRSGLFRQLIFAVEIYHITERRAEASDWPRTPPGRPLMAECSLTAARNGRIRAATGNTGTLNPQPVNESALVDLSDQTRINESSG